MLTFLLLSLLHIQTLGFQYSPGTRCKTPGEPCSYEYIPFGQPPAERVTGFCAPNGFCMDNGAKCQSDDECFGWCGNGICGGHSALCNTKRKYTRRDVMPFWDYACFTPHFKCSSTAEGDLGSCVASDGTEVWEDDEIPISRYEEEEEEEEYITLDDLSDQFIFNAQTDNPQQSLDSDPQVEHIQVDSDPSPLHLRHEDPEEKGGDKFVDPFRQPERYVTHEEVIFPVKFEEVKEPDGLSEEESLQRRSMNKC
ncbi:hypothetical protein BT69DRAFT_578779 [Atractiella rhizophila]|nr:hypothetical protein BT69DRAFT_578779 [Atractiella rhizophila]